MSMYDGGKIRIGSRLMSPSEIAELELSPDEIQVIADEIERQMHSVQWGFQPHLLPPNRNEFCYRSLIYLCGRGSGKTYALEDLVMALTHEDHALPPELGIQTIPKAQILFVGATFGDAIFTFVRPFLDRFGPAGPDSPIASINFTSGMISFNNGCTLRWIGSENPDRPRGMSVHVTILDEIATWSNADILENAQLATRLTFPDGKPGLVIMATTPRVKKWLKPIFEDKTAVKVKATPMDNHHISAENKAAMLALYKPGSLRYRLEILAEEIYASDDALFDPADWVIDLAENFPAPDRKIIVLDPALKIGRDDTGLIVLGRKGDAIQVLADYSSNAVGPDDVVKAIKQAIIDHPEATDLLVESNAGEDWLKKVLLGGELPIHVIFVRANKSKEARAEQAVRISEAGKLHVVKELADGEFGEELTLWSPSSGRRSPGRLDCLAHGVNALLIGKASTSGSSKMSVATDRAGVTAESAPLTESETRHIESASHDEVPTFGRNAGGKRGNTRIVVAGERRNEPRRVVPMSRRAGISSPPRAA